MTAPAPDFVWLSLPLGDGVFVTVYATRHLDVPHINRLIECLYGVRAPITPGRRLSGRRAVFALRLLDSLRREPRLLFPTVGADGRRMTPASASERTDTERLDWLADNHVYFTKGRAHWLEFDYDEALVPLSPDVTLREAIDAGMAKDATP